jgi:putative Mg2+ transporter-C (MgtC) family protein|nr:MAG TPA: MgtC family [Caudoviricetes sp.]
MFFVNLVILILCGFILGYERQKTNKVIGIRSVILLMLGSFIFTYISTRIGGDPSRVAAQIASGVGFIGAGIIWKDKSTNIANLTTAILIWVIAALGSMIAIELFMEAIIITGIIYIVLKFNFLKDV